jgi:hypothetical protein
MEYPAPLTLEFHPWIKQDHILAMKQQNPEIVLIGDSTLYYGVNGDQLSSELGINSYVLALPGSATAAWYLVMKNIIPVSSSHPRYVMILFRDTMLTTPYFRTTGRYFELLDDYAKKNEPLLSEIIYKNQMNPFEKFSEQYLPLYSARWEIREDLDNSLRHKIPEFFNCSKTCSKEAIKSVLGREVDTIAYNQMVNDSAAALYKPEAMNFEQQINRSFLPAMIEMANENNITLIFVRTRTLAFPTAESEPTMLRNYIKSLDLYLSENQDVYFLDFSQDVRLKNDLFLDNLHLNENGKKEFTRILAEEFLSTFGQ